MTKRKLVLLREAIRLIADLADHLPDTNSQSGEDWNWCWNELSGNSQDAVKKVRNKAREFLKRCRD